jgi:hypothetical protein
MPVTHSSQGYRQLPGQITATTNPTTYTSQGSWVTWTYDGRKYWQQQMVIVQDTTPKPQPKPFAGYTGGMR